MKQIIAILALVMLAACATAQQEDTTMTTEETTLVTTESGLQYEIVQPGEGEPAQKGNTVEVHYTGWLMDGAKFDSSLDRNQTFSFRLGDNHVIRGWEEGVLGMKPGEKRVLIIPPELGYGSRGAGGVIPPNATLKFEVELISFK